DRPAATARRTQQPVGAGATGGCRESATQYGTGDPPVGDHRRFGTRQNRVGTGACRATAARNEPSGDDGEPGWTGRGTETGGDRVARSSPSRRPAPPRRSSDPDRPAATARRTQQPVGAGATGGCRESATQHSIGSPPAGDDRRFG